MSAKEIGVGLIGFGTVGAGVVDGLNRHAELMAGRAGVRPVLRAVVDQDLTSDRGVDLDSALLTEDASRVIDHPDVPVVIELIGGTNAARDLVCRALDAKKTVVTANKALLAEHGEEIFDLARKRGVDVYFGASVGGGIPIVRALRDGLVGNRIETIHGILNGTCNYILTRMEREGLDFDACLEAAQKAGYAEADPTLDVDGWDTAHKAAILTWLAHGLHVDPQSICVEGIRELQTVDIETARELGYRVKLLAIVRRDRDEVEVRVHPALVSREHVLASVSDVFNAVMVRGDLVGDTLYYGRGAGREPTASTVLADVVDAARNLAAGAVRGWPATIAAEGAPRLKPMGEVSTRYFLRISLLDRPGTLSRIAFVLGRHGIGIASVIQREECRDEHVPVVVVTHEAREQDVNGALAKLDEMDIVEAPTVRMRIET